MINPDEADKVISKHIGQGSLDDYIRKNEKTSETQVDIAITPDQRELESHLPILFHPDSAPLKLNAYLATALTQLSETDRKDVGKLSDLVNEVCKSLNIELYQPRHSTDPIQHPAVSPEDVFLRDREHVLQSDLIIHIADYASTGSGEELDFAVGALIPIVLICRGDSRLSRMVSGIPALKLIIRYNDFEELRKELHGRLCEMRPVLEERKLSFSSYEKNVVGDKVRSLREESGLTIAEVADSSNGILTKQRLSDIENSNDKMSNPTLIELRTMATILKTTVADLVEPDLSERLTVQIHQFLTGVATKSRYGASDEDIKRLLRHLIYQKLLPMLDTGE